MLDIRCNLTPKDKKKAPQKAGRDYLLNIFFINAILKTLQIALYKYKIQVYFLIFTIFVVNLSQHRKIQRHKGNKRR